MYLVKAEIYRRDSRAMRALTDCQAMHSLVTSFFGKNRQEAKLLYRYNIRNDKLQLYIYAAEPPAEQPKGIALKWTSISKWVDSMQEEQVLCFDIVAAPCKKVPAEGKKHSQRRLLRNPDDRRGWLERKSEQFGFRILAVDELEQVSATGQHKEEDGGRMHHNGYHYQGVLQIVDADAFRRALSDGIGAGKAYGFGMMMVRGTA